MGVVMPGLVNGHGLVVLRHRPTATSTTAMGSHNPIKTYVRESGRVSLPTFIG